MDLLTAEEGECAVQLARATLEYRIGGRNTRIPALSPIFDTNRGVFVTLTENGELRGCIGFPYPHLPLGEAIREAAVSAALQDPRFRPVRPPELPCIRLEVTVLSVPELMKAEPALRPGAVEIGKHGLIVRGYGRSGLLLPQVPIEWGWESREFLDHTCMKAGLPFGCWKEDCVEFYTFEGQIFCEEQEKER
ncbi:MAG: TIGR00296 family protein [Methanoregulaceae archaeon]|nr:TIGR00296 family protein [Methanoregulaceae archaeon]